MALMGHQIGKDLIEALGLPKYTRSFTLRCAADEIVTVECEYYPDGEFQVVLAEYTLVRNPEPAKVDFDAWLYARKEAEHRKLMAGHAGLRRIDANIVTHNAAAKVAKLMVESGAAQKMFGSSGQP